MVKKIFKINSIKHFGILTNKPFGKMPTIENLTNTCNEQMYPYFFNVISK